MQRAQFDHAIRAAGAVLGVDEVLVIGSQAVLGSIDKPFAEAEQSIEVDVAVMNDVDGAQADLIDGSIGELSLFQETFGYYAQGVVQSTAILPPGWQERLVRYASPATGGVTALCLEPHDLWLSKAVAYRSKDIAFCKAMLAHDIVNATQLHKRLASMDVTDRQRQAAAGLIAD